MRHSNIIWFEIPVTNMDRAVRFYSAMLNIGIERRNWLDQEFGMMRKEEIGIGGVLVKKSNISPGIGIALFFQVNVISDAIEAALNNGGKLITPKTLLKQTDEKGNRTIGQNAIDNKTGYFAELLDSEGNNVSLYANY